MANNIIWYKDLGINDIEIVGGKNASLGEMISSLSDMDIDVPNGFATTASAFFDFLKHNNIAEKIQDIVTVIDIEDTVQLNKAGAEIRTLIMNGELQKDLLDDLTIAYSEMEAMYSDDLSVAVRSSATAEDLPDASFAGQQETYLNITGFDNVLKAVKLVFASLYNNRAISYRVHQGFEHKSVALSVGVQKMIRSDIASSGVMFTLDTESGFKDAVLITGAWGLGETVVQGSVNPDEFVVYKPSLLRNKKAILSKAIGSKKIKMIYSDNSDNPVDTVDVAIEDQILPCLSDEQITDLARKALTIENHYGRPMDIEWALDGLDNKLYIVQARPETVESSSATNTLERYELKEKSNIIVTGRAIGKKLGQGIAKIIKDASGIGEVKAGDVLVTDMTDPDWEPVMKKASAIVTNRGGRTCHAAIIARELGIPAIVGCGDATKIIQNNSEITVSCTEGDTGNVYESILDYQVNTSEIGELADPPVKIMMNIANPGLAFSASAIPNMGVGLARLEFIINNTIGIHPKALLNFNALKDEVVKSKILSRIHNQDPIEYYVSKLTQGIATLCASFAPKPVIVRMSDFKSNEYANLIGGALYEPFEENPMNGFRGTSRYLADEFTDCFELECQAIKRVRNDMGLSNLQLMIPFVRTVAGAKKVIALLAKNGLKRGENGLKVIMMCEIPANAVLAEQFLEHFDGFSIGSNDLTQLTLGLDRDSEKISHLFDERNEAVKALITLAITACKKHNKYIGICGQGPSDFPDFAHWLVEQDIDSISLNPDTVINTWQYLSKSFPDKTYL